MKRRGSRRAFTLIEVIAAIAISTVLLAAVYVTLNLMLRSIRMGKQAISALQVVRGTSVRLKTDIRQSLAMLVTTPSIEAALAEAAAAAATTTTTTPGAPASSPMQEEELQPFQFNYGLQGDEYQLRIYGTRQPRYSLIDAETPNSIYSDLRTILYTVDPMQGLVRQEIINVLSGTDEITGMEVLAPEVKDIRFQYYDALTGAYTSTWDGTLNGPPAAVEVTLTVQMPEVPGSPPSQPLAHRFVIAIPTFGSPAQGLGQQQ